MMKPVSYNSINKSYSKSGWISFGLALATGFITLLLLIAWFVPEGGTYTEQRLGKILFVFGLIIAPILHLTGLIFGIIGAFKKDSKKLFSVFGIVLNSLALAVAAVFWLFILLIALAVIGSGGGWM